MPFGIARALALRIYACHHVPRYRNSSRMLATYYRKELIEMVHGEVSNHLIRLLFPDAATDEWMQVFIQVDIAAALPGSRYIKFEASGYIPWL